MATHLPGESARQGVGDGALETGRETAAVGSGGLETVIAVQEVEVRT